MIDVGPSTRELESDLPGSTNSWVKLRGRLNLNPEPDGVDATLAPTSRLPGSTRKAGWKVLRRLDQKGFPDLKGWLFFTLTVDPEKSSSNQVKMFESGTKNGAAEWYALT